MLAAARGCAFVAAALRGTRSGGDLRRKCVRAMAAGGGEVRRAQDVLRFWFADPETQAEPDFGKWYGGGAELDKAVREGFGATVEAAVAGELDEEWGATATGALGLVIVLDQFTRNVFRGSGRAFSGDARARSVARTIIQQHWDVSDYGVFGKMFGVCLPLMHSEDLADFELLDERIKVYSAKHGRDAFVQTADFAQEHRVVIERFGRYPHRNAALNRASTAEELEYLASLPAEKRYGQ